MIKKVFLSVFLLFCCFFLYSEYHIAWITAEPDTIFQDENITYSTITVCLQDEFNLPVSGERVDFQATIGGIIPYDFTDSNGIAETLFYDSNDLGTATITVWVDGENLAEIQVEILPVVSADDKIPFLINTRNYPNPLRSTGSDNPGTNISFSISSKAKDLIDQTAVISIYSLKGQLIRRLKIERVANADSCSIYWNGKDEKGNPADSGIYIYIVSINDESISGKMSVLK
jgi:hypothetical protein